MATIRSKTDACLYRHEINGNYYAIKKIRSKIKTHALGKPYCHYG